MKIPTRWISLGLSLLGIGGVGLTSYLSVKGYEEAKGKEDVLKESGKENFRTLLETVCSFSNEPGQNGGIILYGFGKNHENYSANHYIVEGVNDVDKTQLDIATQCKESFNLPVYPEITVETIEGCQVLRILVHELPDAKKASLFQEKRFA